MPCVAFFYGIAISMYYNDHAPPHVHAAYQGYRALVRIEDGVVMAGSLPPVASRIVREWVVLRRASLDLNWSRGERDELFEKIAGPDDSAS